nr:hypothetical protein BaRGS_013191 [Batillaria attramentaria]
MIAYVLFLPELFKVQDLQLTLLCVSGAVFLFLPCAFAFKPAVHELGDIQLDDVSPSYGTFSDEKSETSSSATPEPDSRADPTCGCGSGKLLNVRIWRNRGYVTFVVTIVIAFFGFFVPIIHVVKHSEALHSRVTLSTAVSDGNKEEK